VSKQWKPSKPTVELRPSRIRRDPLRVKEAERLSNNAWWDSQEWEMRFAMAGIIFFALGISALVIDLGEILGL